MRPRQYRVDVNRVRRRVRAWATVWLVCQLTAVSAFVPRDCCAEHRRLATVSESHGAHGAHHHHRPVHDDRSCVMRGTCNGPLDAIATLFMAPGLPLQPFTLLDDGAPRRGLRQADASAIDSLHLPATPPPRA